MRSATCCMTLCLAPDSSERLRNAVSKILGWCWGLPIALSVTGSTVALLEKRVGSLERACEKYVTDVEEEGTNVEDERDRRGTKLREGIRLSLKIP